MTEAEVAAQVALNTEPSRPIPSEYPEPPVASEDSNSNFVDKMLPEEQLTATQIMDYLQIPFERRHDPDTERRVQSIYQWARENAGTNDLPQLLRVISEQEMHLGSKLKPDRVRRLAEYISINKMRQNLAARERLLYE